MAVSRRVLLGLLCASCSYGVDPDQRSDFVVSFLGQSTGLDAAARAVIARAVAAAKASKLGVVVAGFADTSIAPEANQIQSRIRAQRVADALVAAGITRDRVELKPRRALGGDPGVESRRVDIRIGA